MLGETITTISPSTNQAVLTRQGPTKAEASALLEASTKAFQSFSQTSLQERQSIVKKALQLVRASQDALAEDLTVQMGRPISYGTKEVATAVARGEYMLSVSEEVLRDTEGEPEAGFKRYIRKVPVGPVLVLFAWNVRLLSPGWESRLTNREMHSIRG